MTVTYYMRRKCSLKPNTKDKKCLSRKDIYLEYVDNERQDVAYLEDDYNGHEHDSQPELLFLTGRQG